MVQCHLVVGILHTIARCQGLLLLLLLHVGDVLLVSGWGHRLRMEQVVSGLMGPTSSLLYDIDRVAAGVLKRTVLYELLTSGCTLIIEDKLSSSTSTDGRRKSFSYFLRLDQQLHRE